jgi:hypothetical protein
MMVSVSELLMRILNTKNMKKLIKERIKEHLRRNKLFNYINEKGNKKLGFQFS